jgi:hypothetical protein
MNQPQTAHPAGHADDPAAMVDFGDDFEIAETFSGALRTLGHTPSRDHEVFYLSTAAVADLRRQGDGRDGTVSADDGVERVWVTGLSYPLISAVPGCEVTDQIMHWTSGTGEIQVYAGDMVLRDDRFKVVETIACDPQGKVQVQFEGWEAPVFPAPDGLVAVRRYVTAAHPVEAPQPAAAQEVLTLVPCTVPAGTAQACSLNREPLGAGTTAFTGSGGLIICVACAAHAVSCTDSDCAHPRYVHGAPAQHTCGGVVFGRKNPGCPRCDQLLAGAPPIVQEGRRDRRADDAQRRADLAAHFASEKHRSGGCGPVCTFGDW